MPALVQFKKDVQEKLDSATIKEGNILVTTDKGNLYVDVDGENRVQINAKGATELIKQDGSTLPAGNVVTTDDIIDVAHGGTGKDSLEANSLLLGNDTEEVKTVAVPADNFIIGDAINGIQAVDAETARSKLSVYDKATVDTKVKEATAMAYYISLEVANWKDNSTADLTKYGKYICEVNITDLQGGKNHNVPPIISCTSNTADYNKINYAQATVNESVNKVSFFADEKPTAKIDLIVTDVN